MEDKEENISLLDSLTYRLWDLGWFDKSPYQGYLTYHGDSFVIEVKKGNLFLASYRQILNEVASQFIKTLMRIANLSSIEIDSLDSE